MNDANTNGRDTENSQPDLRDILGTSRSGRKKKSRRYLYAAAAVVLIGGALVIITSRVPQASPIPTPRKRRDRATFPSS